MGTSDAAALALLRRALTDVRAALGEEAHRLSSPSPSSLRLDLSGEAFLDVWAFDQAMASRTEEGLNHAIALYRGPLMPDLNNVSDGEGVIQREREQRNVAFLDALESRAQRLLQSGNTEAATTDLRRLLAADPLRESASRALMEHLANQNQRSAALAEYHRLRELMAKTLHSEPSPALRAVYERLQTAREPAAIPHNLPFSPTRFIGREPQPADLRNLLRKTRLLTLTGAGGVGKTRLALVLAFQLLEAYPDEGVWFVELAALNDPLLLPQTVAKTLSLRETPGRTLTETILRFVDNKRLLIVLDNAEHMVDACARFAAALLRACPNVSLIVTSREPLGTAGELTVRVPSLSFPNQKEASVGAATCESLTTFEAVNLFVERAQFAQPDFVLSDANAATVAQICCRLDGIPLALELAAARLRSLPLETIHDRISSGFGFLTGSGDRSALPRQQTLHALLDWSYHLLGVEEKILLARLSCFSGGWTLQAAETVCGFTPLDRDAVVQLLARLVEKSLVQAEKNETTEDTTHRYRLLQTVWEYGAEKLEGSGTGEKADVQKKHLDWCVDLAEKAEAHFQGPEQAKWLNRLENEHDNLRAALGYGLAVETDAARLTSGLRLAGALWRFWQMRGYLSEGRDFLDRLLAHRNLLSGAGTTPIVAKALSAAGILTSGQGDYAAAQARQEESLSLFRAIDDQAGIAHASMFLGLVFYSQGDGAAAWKWLHESLAISRTLGNTRTAAAALNNLGTVAAYSRSDWAAAQMLYEESLALFRQIGDERGIAYALKSLGAVALAQNNDEEARVLLAESLRRFHALGDMRGITYTLESIATLCSRKGGCDDYLSAATLWGACQTLRRNLGAPLPHNEQLKQDEEVAQGAAIAGDAEVWAKAWGNGNELACEAAVSFALDTMRG